jgi:pyruvate/2-oxoglutarate dehydrogenase complex dihydrolipoamide acyltransferase (E2) component
MIDVHIPKMGMSTIEVDIVNVAVAVGDRVAADSVIVEVEGDKAQVDVEAGAAGVVAEVLVATGDEREVGDVVARIHPDEAA